jgi:hypothetical protein
MAQVNCLAQGGKSPLTDCELTVDLCNSNGIKFCTSSFFLNRYERSDGRPPNNII